MLLEEIKHIKESKKDLRKFGLSVGTVLLIISGLFYYFDKPAFIYFALIGAYLFLVGLFFPSTLKPLNKIWMALAIILGFISSRIILTVLFYIVLTPIGLIAKLTGKKFLVLKYDHSAVTYWEKSSQIHKKKVDYERQF
jgi:hypothetical protein